MISLKKNLEKVKQHRAWLRTGLVEGGLCVEGALSRVRDPFFVLTLMGRKFDDTAFCLNLSCSDPKSYSMACFLTVKF